LAAGFKPKMTALQVCPTQWWPGGCSPTPCLSRTPTVCDFHQTVYNFIFPPLAYLTRSVCAQVLQGRADRQQTYMLHPIMHLCTTIILMSFIGHLTLI